MLNAAMWLKHSYQMEGAITLLHSLIGITYNAQLLFMALIQIQIGDNSFEKGEDDLLVISCVLAVPELSSMARPSLVTILYSCPHFCCTALVMYGTFAFSSLISKNALSSLANSALPLAPYVSVARVIFTVAVRDFLGNTGLNGGGATS